MHTSTTVRYLPLRGCLVDAGQCLRLLGLFAERIEDNVGALFIYIDNIALSFYP